MKLKTSSEDPAPRQRMSIGDARMTGSSTISMLHGGDNISHASDMTSLSHGLSYTAPLSSLPEGIHESEDMMTSAGCSGLKKMPARGVIYPSNLNLSWRVAEEKCRILEATCTALENVGAHAERCFMAANHYICTCSYKWWPVLIDD